MTTMVREGRLLKRRIIERPRLISLLNDTKARVRMLVAPAGYGKTTLSEQWVARDGREGAWYQARSASTDVAALALGIAKNSLTIVEDCDKRLREHLRALTTPADDVRALAEILAEDLASWPSTAWLVIDDYHEIAEEPLAERFVEALVAASSINFLIASRQRPAWVSTKMILYGDVFELNQTALAMDAQEAAEVLVARSVSSASGITALANGWPAVIGLASVSSAEPNAEVNRMPESLYRYFAEEVFGSLGRDIQLGLTTLAVAPVLDRQLAVALLGEQGAESVCGSALDVGVLVERRHTLELHPLARSFLREWGAQLGLLPTEQSIQTCLEHYRLGRDWDAALEVLSDEGPPAELESFLTEALDELLATARVSTVQRWCELAAAAGLDSPIFSLANAEVMLRLGRHLESMAHAEAAASRDPALAFRALSLAGRAAHLASREERALELYESAMALARDDAELREAEWGRLACLIDLEHESAEPTLRRLSSSVSIANPRDYVRSAVLRVYLQLRLGALDLDEADVAAQLLPSVSDPSVALSFLSGYGIALALAARYREAQQIAEELLETAEHHRFSFAIPHGHCVSAMALSGLRNWSGAEAAALEALGQASERRDVHVELLSTSILLRLYAQQSRYRDALRLAPETRGALNASIAEYKCSRALVLACAGRSDEALNLISSLPVTRAVEPVVLTPAVEAIAACRSASSDPVDRAQRLEDVAFQRGAVDLLVTSYRACPELMTVLLHVGQGGRIHDLMRKAGDEDLAEMAGYPVPDAADRTSRLSPRENEVYELLLAGLTNAQIARALFIAPSTAKLHTHHVYDKLGVRSRKALAIQAALARTDQATSATDSDDSGGVT